MSKLSCVACGAQKAPCCATTANGGTGCDDKQACGADHMCPAAVGPGWAGDPCGTSDPKCQGKLTCDTPNNVCICGDGSDWTQCKADNKSVCAPGTPVPPTYPPCKNPNQCAAGQGFYACDKLDGGGSIPCDKNPDNLKNNPKCHDICSVP